MKNVTRKTVCQHTGSRTRLSEFGSPERTYDLCDHCGLIVPSDDVPRPVQLDVFAVA
ncbi:MAG: hypothetical protein JWP11_3807 [Frankiales bacterium]|nr:hypothetical protein [Frankiales bacterium]